MLTVTPVLPPGVSCSKSQLSGSCARVTVAPASQQLAPNPSNLLKARAVPAPAGTSGSRRQPPPPKAPDGEKVCDSSSYSYEELVGPLEADKCGSYEVRMGGTTNI